VAGLTFLADLTPDAVIDMLGRWALQYICTGLPSRTVKPDHPNEPHAVAWFRVLSDEKQVNTLVEEVLSQGDNPNQAFTLLPHMQCLLVLYGRYFSGQDNLTQKAYVAQLGISVNTLAKRLTEAYNWCAAALLRRERMVQAGLPADIVAMLTEFTVLEPDFRLPRDEPLHLWVQNEVPGTGKTQYALQVAAWMLTGASRTVVPPVDRMLTGASRTSVPRVERLVFVSYAKADTFDHVGALMLLHRALFPDSDAVPEDEGLLHEQIREKLVTQRTLVILDNFETVRDAQCLAVILIDRNPETSFVFTSRELASGVVGVALVVSPTLKNPNPLIRSTLGLNVDIPEALWKAVRKFDYHLPMFWNFALSRVVRGESTLDKLVETIDRLADGKDPQNGFLGELKTMQTEIWAGLNGEAKSILMDMILSGGVGVREAWLQMLSVARNSGSDHLFRTGWAVVQAAFLLSPSPNRVFGLHSFTRDSLEQVLMKDVSGESARLDAHHQQTLETTLVSRVRLDNLKFMAENFSNLVRWLSKGETKPQKKNGATLGNADLRQMPEVVWQLYATTATLGFEAHKWMDVEDWLKKVLDSADAADSLEKVLAVHEMMMVLSDIVTSRGERIKDENRAERAKVSLEACRKNVLKATPTSARYYRLIAPLMESVEALIAFSTNGPSDAQALIERALAGLEAWDDPDGALSPAFLDALTFVRGLAAIIYWRLGDARSIALFDRARAYYVATGQRMRTWWINSNSALSYNQWLPLNEAAAQINDAIENGEKIGHRWTRLTNLGVRGVILLGRGQLGEAHMQYKSMFSEILSSIKQPERRQTYEALLEKPLADVAQLGDDPWDFGIRREMARLMGNWGAVALHQGEWNSAHMMLNNDLAFGNIRRERSHAETRLNLALLYWLRDDTGNLEGMMRAVEPVAFKPSYLPLQVLYWRMRALLTSDTDEALGHLDRALAIAQDRQRRFDEVAVRLHQAALRNAYVDWRAAIADLTRLGAQAWVDRLDFEARRVVLPLMY
jgi:hypothetical protein